MGSAVTRQWECAVSRSPRQPVILAARTGTVPMLGIDLAVTAGNRHRKDSLDRDKNINVRADAPLRERDHLQAMKG